MNPSMRQKQTKAEQDALLTGPTTGSNMKTVDPAVKKILCPALGLANEVIVRDEYVEKPVPVSEPQVSSKHAEKSRDKKKKKHHSRSRSRSRSRSPYYKKKKNRSRSRSTSRDRRRSRSRDRYDRDRRDNRDDGRGKSSRHGDRSEYNRVHETKPTEPVVGEVIIKFYLNYSVIFCMGS